MKLESGPAVDRTLEEVEAAVRAACGAGGIVLCVVKPSRAHDGMDEWYNTKKLTCQRGGANRQVSHHNSLDAMIHGTRTGLSSTRAVLSQCPVMGVFERDAMGASPLQARTVGFHCTH